MKKHRHGRFQFLQRNRNRKAGDFWVPLAFTVLAIALVPFVVMHSKPGNVAAAPFTPACEPHGYLFQYQFPSPVPPTHVNPIDLVSNTLGTTVNIPGVTVNAVGYNVLDNYIYGWDNGNNEVVRINGDFTIDSSFSVASPPSISASVPAGDVDQNGQYWFATSSDWYRLDLTGSPVTYNGDTGAIYGGALPNFLAPSSADVDFPRDFAYVPPTILNDNNNGQEGLYTVVIDRTGPSDTVELYRFNTTTIAAPTWDHIGSLTNPSMPDNSIEVSDIGQAGALYADGAGALYVAGNNDGSLWRVIIGNASEAIALRPYTLATGSPSNGNDGVRCASALLPADFGDAPSSYATLAGDFGPLHLIGQFNETASTSDLMLGDKIDMEDDGFGGASEAPGAKQDDDNHQPLPFVDDEDSVQHIVAPPSPTDLSVPVVVTNTSSNPATLAGWIDTNGDGSFSDEQRVVKDVPANAGRGTYELIFPGIDLSSNSYARFRLYEGTGLTNDQLQPSGLESAFLIGEVEDYEVQVGSFSAKKTAGPPAGSDVSPGETLTYTLTIANTGTTDLTDLTVNDDLSDVLDDATLEGDPVVDPSSAGNAAVNGDTLEFKGDIPTGQSVTVTYKVKVKPADQLANNSMQNYVIAAHTNCHPDVNSDGSITISHADCNTHHQVSGLANTGRNMILPIVLALVLIGAAGTAFYLGRKHFASRGKTPPTKQQ